MSDGAPVVDESFAQGLVGKRILVGLTYQRYSGEMIEQRQLHGVVEHVGPEGILLRLANGTTFTLPPEFRAIEPAPSGTYTLRSTGEDVIDPDYLSTWTITRPDA